MAHYGGPTGLTFGGWHPDSHHLLLIDNNNERVIWADLVTNDYHPIKLNPDPTTFIPFREVALAPQGDYFTYITINADQQTVINRYDLAKQEITPLTTLEVHPAQIKAWRFSPNGDKAAYLLKKGKRLTGVSYNLELFDLTTATNSTLVEGNLGRTEPVWSPDGRMIAFSRKSLDEPDVAGANSSVWQGNIWLVTLATGQVQQLTFVEGAATQPVWSADSRFIAFITHSDEIGLVDVTQPGYIWRMGATIPYPQLTTINFIR
jgi:Tol biopolymer transport system component